MNTEQQSWWQRVLLVAGLGLLTPLATSVQAEDDQLQTEFEYTMYVAQTQFELKSDRSIALGDVEATCNWEVASAEVCETAAETLSLATLLPVEFSIGEEGELPTRATIQIAINESIDAANCCSSAPPLAGSSLELPEHYSETTQLKLNSEEPLMLREAYRGRIQSVF